MATVVALAGFVLVAAGCQPSVPPPAMDATYDAARERMVREQLAAPGRDIRSPSVLRVMGAVPRHLFVPPNLRGSAYTDHPLPIGYGQTISQPYIVAFMTEQLDPRPTDRVLEIGTGSGYQAAVLAQLVAEVYSIEILEPLARQAEGVLWDTGCTNVHVRVGDGYQGWPEAGPFDAIIVTCSPDHVPTPLTQQLKEGGRMIIPVDSGSGQELVLLEKHGDSLSRRRILAVRFVPMLGESAQDPRRGAKR